MDPKSPSKISQMGERHIIFIYIWIHSFKCTSHQNRVYQLLLVISGALIEEMYIQSCIYIRKYFLCSKRNVVMLHCAQEIC